MKTKFSLMLIAITSFLVSQLQTRADTIALSFSNDGGSGTTQDVTAGWEFSLASDVFVTQLGAWDENNTDPLVLPPGDGLRSNQLITIWTSTGTFVTSATVPAGGGTLIDGFRYVSIPSTLLTAGSYVIGDYYDPTNSDPNVEFGKTITTAPGVTWLDARDDSGNAFPTFVLSGNGVFGPNFQFVNAIPDAGATFVLLALALGAIFSGQLVLSRRGI